MPSIELKVQHSSGLHARPAADFVKLADKFPCEIKVQNLTTESDKVNAKSILSVLSLGINQGHTIKIDANGAKAEAAIEALSNLIINGSENM